MVEQARNNPRVIGGIYRLGQVIKQSPVLTTYTAYNRNTANVVGLQVIELPQSFDVQAMEQLLQPLERRRAVQSTHVLRVYDWGIDRTRAYIATDPPRGVTLRHILDNENVDVQRALDFAQQIAHGLSELHKQGIVDIDLRPELITVDTVGVTDRVQLDDIGLRPLLRELGYLPDPSLDDIGYRDPRYASPESITAGVIGPHSDVYQLGLLLFELVTGRLPFVGRNAAETAVLQSTSSVPRMLQFKQDTAAELQDIVDRALAKNPSSRFPSVEALLAALQTVQLPQHSMSDRGQAGERPTSPHHVLGAEQGKGMAKEMRSVEEDMSLLDTLIEGRSPDSHMPAIPTREGTYAYLCYEQAGAETQRFAITRKDVVVGRADPKRSYTPDIDLTKLDPKMTLSRRHARIRYEETFFSVEDLESHNRTRLGSQILTPKKPEVVQHGDILQFGAVRLEFKVPGMPDHEKKRR
jgi:serine/threonine protein kinase